MGVFVLVCMFFSLEIFQICTLLYYHYIMMALINTQFLLVFYFSISVNIFVTRHFLPSEVTVITRKSVIFHLKLTLFIKLH